MSCHTVQRFISAYLDRSLAREDRDRVTQHLADCRECAARSEEVRHIREMVRALPVAEAPPELSSRLRVLASHERARRLARMDLYTRLTHWGDRVRLFADNLMRPVALPFAGGLVSALFLFGMLVPTLLFQFNLHNDVPTAFYTEPSLIEALEPAPFGIKNDDMVVELTINEKGVVTDYALRNGLKPDLEAQNDLLLNLVWFSRYNPATLFGQPTSGKVTVSVRRSHIVVRG